MVFNPELLRIQKALQSLLETIGTTLALKYVVMDGHFGNYPSALHGQASEFALDFQAAFRCGALSSF